MYLPSAAGFFRMTHPDLEKQLSQWRAANGVPEPVTASQFVLGEFLKAIAFRAVLPLLGAALVISVLMAFLHPESNVVWFFGAAIVVLAAIFFGLLRLASR
jgi:ABC-type multidrug transport system permease subunit